MKPFSDAHWSRAEAAQHSSELWNAASGYLVIVLGAAGAAFERGRPPFTAPVEEVVAFWSTYQRELLAQSMMFVLSAGAYLWFCGSLRTVLMRAEGSTGTLSTIAFGAGIVSAGLQMILQCFQVALAVAASGALEQVGCKLRLPPSVSGRQDDARDHATARSSSDGVRSRDVSWLRFHGQRDAARPS